MQEQVNMDDIFTQSEDVVSREIEGEYILVPITAGIGDMEDEIYSLNPAGRAIWDKLDGQKSLNTIKEELLDEFEGTEKEIKDDVTGFISELYQRKMVNRV